MKKAFSACTASSLAQILPLARVSTAAPQALILADLLLQLPAGGEGTSHRSHVSTSLTHKTVQYAPWVCILEPISLMLPAGGKGTSHRCHVSALLADKTVENTLLGFASWGHYRWCSLHLRGDITEKPVIKTASSEYADFKIFQKLPLR